MPHGFVEQYPRGAGAHHHWHLPAFRTACLEEAVDPADGAADQVFGHLRADQLSSCAQAARHVHHLGASSLPEDGLDGNAAERAAVGGQLPEGVVHQYLAHRPREHRYHLQGAALAAAYAGLDALEEGREAAAVETAPAEPDRVAVVRAHLGGRHAAERRLGLGRSHRGYGRCGPGGAHQVFVGGAFGVGVTGLLALEHAYSAAPVDMVAGRAHLGVPQQEVVVDRVLEVEVAPVPAVLQTFGHEGAELVFGDCESVNILHSDILCSRWCGTFRCL